MKIREIVAPLEEFAPLALQEHYDNAGLIVGDPDNEADAALVCVDVTEAVLEEAVATGAGMRRVWTGRAFVPLGEGDLDLAAVMELITGGQHTGWLVVEQDVIPQVGDEPDRPQREQVHNRQVLRRWFP